ncbi:twin transmembrane helix small protein [Hirschia litorea]|uniref:Twin transmembrane helix small protein n=1 Tax=Hirschia litorea TaxID=1199156 RepID=A0ABW2ILM2_9PROT
MNTPLSILLYIAMAAVFIILVFGLVNLFSKSDKQPSRSNKLMRLRVLVQFIAIILLVAIGFSSGVIG